MSDSTAQTGVERAHKRLDDQRSVLESHDSRITQLERWKLQVVGAFKFAAFMAGTSFFGLLVDFFVL